MDYLNAILFPLINAPAAPGAFQLALARVVAEWLIWLVAAAVAVGYLHGGLAARVAIIRAGLAAVLALAANVTIAAVWYHPRPFELGVGHQFLPHAVETSFPSDHGTVLFAIALGLFAFGARRAWAGLALVAAVAVAWARVWLGVHWPLDMAGSALVAGLAVLLVSGVARHSFPRRFERLILALTDTALNRLRIPARLAPRIAGSDHPSKAGRPFRD